MALSVCLFGRLSAGSDFGLLLRLGSRVLRLEFVLLALSDWRLHLGA